jgi:pimeloyl-ACP methyl ester carboxylesterase
MTYNLDVAGGKIAYDLAGAGPLVLLGHGLADNRNAFRFLVPQLVAAGYRVANMDLRGHGQSSVPFASYSRTDVAGDMIALIRQLGGPAIIIGHSFSGAAAAIVAADAPDLVTAIVQVDPGTRTPKMKLGDLNGRFVKGISLILSAAVLRSTKVWGSYLRHAFPGTRPKDFDLAVQSLQHNLSEPGRMAAGAKMAFSSPADAEAKLPAIRCPALVIMGTLDPDFPNPTAEAEGIVAQMPAGLGALAMIEGAGHYPHTQCPDEVVRVALPFLSAHTHA